jgi:hypothetical protein
MFAPMFEAQIDSFARRICAVFCRAIVTQRASVCGPGTARNRLASGPETNHPELARTLRLGGVRGVQYNQIFRGKTDFFSN